MNTKKILFAVFAFGIFTMATYVPTQNSDQDRDSTENYIPRNIGRDQVRA